MEILEHYLHANKIYITHILQTGRINQGGESEKPSLISTTKVPLSKVLNPPVELFSGRSDWLHSLASSCECV